MKRTTAEAIIVAPCVFGGIGLVAAADLAGVPGLRWLGAGLVIAAAVALASTSRW